jgi:hypothetical protein
MTQNRWQGEVKDMMLRLSVNHYLQILDEQCSRFEVISSGVDEEPSHLGYCAILPDE